MLGVLNLAVLDIFQVIQFKLYSKLQSFCDFNSVRFNYSAVLPGIVRNAFAPDGPDSDARREDEANDCLTDRQAVLDEQVSWRYGSKNNIQSTFLINIWEPTSLWPLQFQNKLYDSYLEA